MSRFRCALAALVLTAPVALFAQGHISLPVPLAELQKRVKADSNDAFAHYNVALGYWDAKKWEDVDRELKTAIALTPRFAQAHLALAYLGFAKETDFWREVRDAGRATPKRLVDIYEYYRREYRHAFLIDPMVDMSIIAATTRAEDEAALRAVFGPSFADYATGVTACNEGRYPECELRMERVTHEIAAEEGRKEAPNDVYWHRGIAAAHNKHFDLAASDFKHLLDKENAAVQKASETNIIRSPLRGNEYRYFEAVFEQAGGHTAEAT